MFWFFGIFISKINIKCFGCIAWMPDIRILKSRMTYLLARLCLLDLFQISINAIILDNKNRKVYDWISWYEKKEHWFVTINTAAGIR